MCEPDNSQVLGSGIPQPRKADGSPPAAIPRFRPHLMQGWRPDFIPKLTEDAVALRADRRDRARSGSRCAANCRASSRSKEGIFVGISGGATLAGALQVCARRARRRERRSACCPTRASAT